MTAPTLPTFDLRDLAAPGSERAAVLDNLRQAARGLGFFYLTGHGIPDDLIRDVLGIARRFFALPETEGGFNRSSQHP